MSDREQTRRDAEAERYWTDPQRTARHYCRIILALIAEAEENDRQLNDALAELERR